MTSKYSTLPDIDTAPDLYETPDYPTLSTATELNDSDEDSPAFHTPYEGTEGEGGEREEGVVRGGVNFNEAKKRFAGARGEFDYFGWKMEQESRAEVLGVELMRFLILIFLLDGNQVVIEDYQHRLAILIYRKRLIHSILLLIQVFQQKRKRN